MPTIDSVVSRAAVLAPDQTAVHEWEANRKLTYGELDAALSSFAAWMRAHGLSDGQAVALHLPNSSDFLIAQFSSFRAGAVAVYVNYRLSAAESVRQIRLGGARVIVTTKVKMNELRDFPELKDAIFVLVDRDGTGEHNLQNIIQKRATIDGPVDREDKDAIIRFTSGSTGAPKGIIVTHRAWLIRAVSMLAETIQVVPHSTTMVLGPLTHQAGLFVLPTFLRLGTLLIISDFDPLKVADALARERISCAPFVPTVIGFLLENPASREALRNSGITRIMYGGSPIRRTVLDEAIDLLPNTEFFQSYGSHEAGSISYLNHADHQDPMLRSSAGKPLLAAAVQLGNVNADGIGEIEVKAPWTPHARLTEAGREPIPDGWIPTGDLAELKHGYIFLRDRMNDVIISGGFNVYPMEIENVIDSYSDVAGSAVVSAPDDRWGERIVAFVVPKNPSAFQQDALRDYCRSRLANYKVPKDIIPVSEIPLNVNGKPDRRRLSQPMWEGHARRIN